jgi:hypothetical protein
VSGYAATCERQSQHQQGGGWAAAALLPHQPALRMPHMTDVCTLCMATQCRRCLIGSKCPLHTPWSRTSLMGGMLCSCGSTTAEVSSCVRPELTCSSTCQAWSCTYMTNKGSLMTAECLPPALAGKPCTHHFINIKWPRRRGAGRQQVRYGTVCTTGHMSRRGAGYMPQYRLHSETNQQQLHGGAGRNDTAAAGLEAVALHTRAGGACA